MREVYDEALFAGLQAVGNFFNEVDWLTDHVRIAHEERERFLNNEIENPRFTYRPQTERVDFHELASVFQKQIRESTAPAVVLDLYERKLGKQVTRGALVGASLQGDDQRFFEASTKLYGKPRKKFFSYIAKRLIQLCDEEKATHTGAARRLRRVVAKINTDVDIDASVLPEPVRDTAIIESTDQVVEIFTETLDRCEISDWVVVVDASGKRTRFSVQASQKAIHVPSVEMLERRPIPLTDIEVRGLAEHEIGVHVRRSEVAKSGPLRLLGVGLDGYLLGEEGLAAYVQQQVTGATEFYGFDRYLAACLAVGMDGEVRDFRAVFSLMVDYYTLKFAAEHSQVRAPFRAAWDVCVRIFRGTTGQTAGCIFTKDIVYLEGNIGVWHLLSEKPHVFESLFVGKFNQLSSRHVRTLQTLEILEEW